MEQSNALTRHLPVHALACGALISWWYWCACTSVPARPSQACPLSGVQGNQPGASCLAPLPGGRCGGISPLHFSLALTAPSLPRAALHAVALRSLSLPCFACAAACFLTPTPHPTPHTHLPPPRCRYVWRMLERSRDLPLGQGSQVGGNERRGRVVGGKERRGGGWGEARSGWWRKGEARWCEGGPARPVGGGGPARRGCSPTALEAEGPCVGLPLPAECCFSCLAAHDVQWKLSHSYALCSLPAQHGPAGQAGGTSHSYETAASAGAGSLTHASPRASRPHMPAFAHPPEYSPPSSASSPSPLPCPWPPCLPSLPPLLSPLSLFPLPPCLPPARVFSLPPSCPPA